MRSCCQPACAELSRLSLHNLTGGGAACCDASQYSDSGSCNSCLRGADCSVIGITLATQPLQPGYRRASNATTDVRECWYAEACARLDATAASTDITVAARRITTNTTAAITIDDSKTYCSAGYKGPCKLSLQYLTPAFARLQTIYTRYFATLTLHSNALLHVCTTVCFLLQIAQFVM
jgi:hypothetical protein